MSAVASTLASPVFPPPFSALGEGSPMGLDADLAAIQEDLQLFCKIFIAGF